MGSDGKSTDDIKKRIKPTLDKVAVEGLRAWLKAIGLPSGAYSRVAITELVAKHIAEGQLVEAALEKALIGFEEASDMRIYLFRLEEVPSKPLSKWLPGRLITSGILPSGTRAFAFGKTKPMSPVYGELNGKLLRVKWAEEQYSAKLNDKADAVVQKPVLKRVVLIANFNDYTAELRLNPPENRHSYEDASGRITGEAYYSAYTERATQILGCKLAPVELRPVVKSLVEEEDPRVIRIHIDNHTNQKNTKSKTHSSRADVRDDPDWQLTYVKNGTSWAMDAQSFYWLPKASSGFLTRELFTHIDAEEGFVKVNADCSDEEVTHVVSQIRAREEA